ncbi:MAG TPA: nucleotidyltransferase family protein [Thermodesulfovibrionales bacterium]|nr:nucleotidyltransferase family protein [Thermodesulfovibrionales bacterium]
MDQGTGGEVGKISEAATNKMSSMHAVKDARLTTLFKTIISPAGRSACPCLGAEDLLALKDLALRNDVLPLLYVQLMNCSVSETDDVRRFLDDVKPYFLLSAICSMKQEVLEKEVLSLLREEGVRAMVIKGNAIARDIYEDRNCRISEDVDILIPRSDLFRAAAILSGAGYSGEGEVPLEYRAYSIHHAIFYKAQNTIPIEMHWFFGVPSFFDLTSEEIWNEVVCDGEGNCRLSPELQIVLLLVHHHSHSFREFKTLVDIYWTLWRHNAGIDWPLFASRLEKVGLIKTTRITLSQIKKIWNDIPGGNAVEKLAEEIEKRGNRLPKRFVSYFSMEVTGTRRQRSSLDKLIKRLALDRPSAIFRSFRSLLPSFRAVGARYGGGSLWRLPIDYSRFVIWQLKCWRG